jgi:hypothetical protein
MPAVGAYEPSTPLFPEAPLSAPVSIAITTAGANVFRWGPDEWNPENIPQALAFSNAIPGLFKICSITLARKLTVDYSDLNLLDDIVIYGAGNKVLWEGFITQLPRTHQDAFSIVVGAVGYAAYLMKATGFRELYIDRDLSAWGEPSLQRRIDLSGGGYRFEGSASTGMQDPGSGGSEPGISLSFSTFDTNIEIGEAWYHGGGADIGEVRYDFLVPTGGSKDTDWNDQILLSSDDRTTSYDGGTDHDKVPANDQVTTATVAGRKYAAMQSGYAGTFTGSSNQVTACAAVRVIGTHGLPITGADKTTEGVLASDVVVDAVKRAAPLLSIGEIVATDFPIPHLSFRTPVTAQDVIMAANVFHLWDWGVGPGKKFFFRPPDPTRMCWVARLDEGTKLDLDGEQSADLFNGVFIDYTDEAGVARTAGPPGSGADTEDAALVDASPSNPINAHGIDRDWASLNISRMCVTPAAVQLGRIYLAEKSLPQRRGTLIVTGTVGHPSGGRRSVAEMWGGHYVRVADHPVDVPRKIIEAQYTHDSEVATCSLDNTSQKLDAIMERYGVRLMGVI